MDRERQSQIGPLHDRLRAWFPRGPGYGLAEPMAIESKPLFHPEIIRRSVRAFPLPEFPTDIYLAAFSTACGFSSASRSSRSHRPHAGWRNVNQLGNFSE